MKEGGVSIVEEGPDVGTRLTYCSIWSAHQEEIQLLKKRPEDEQYFTRVRCEVEFMSGQH